MAGTKSKYYLNIVFIFGCLSLFACRTAQYMETTGEATVEVKSLTLFGFNIDEDTKELYTKEQLAKQQAQITAKAEADAKAKTIMFTIKKKQDREDVKQDTAKLVSWGSFAIAAFAIIMAVVTSGYAKWGVMAGAFFIVGTTAIIIPELSDIINWVVIVGGAIGIFMALSHSKNFSIGKSLQNITNPRATDQPPKDSGYHDPGKNQHNRL
jgi:hypothetical protein